MKTNFYIKRFLIIAAVANLLIFSVAAMAEGDTIDPNDCTPFAVGSWTSSTGSTLTITSVENNIIKGTFLRNPPAVNITGSLSPVTSGDCPLSFSAYWPATSEYYPTVTSYTGEIDASQGRMRTIFLYVDPNAKNPYQSVSIGIDMFEKK